MPYLNYEALSADSKQPLRGRRDGTTRGAEEPKYFFVLQQSSMTNSHSVEQNRRRKAMQRVAIALAVLGLLWIGSLYAYASLAERNSYSSCADYVPASLSDSEYVVQTKSRVTILPLTLECSFSAEALSDNPDYVVVEKDLGTAWWLGAPASFLAAAAVWATSRRKNTDSSDGPAK